MIISEKISGQLIKVLIQSSNLKEAEYHTGTKSLIVKFNSNKTYLYTNVPWEVFTKLRMAESQGKYFIQEISKHYNYKEIIEEEQNTDDDTTA